MPIRQREQKIAAVVLCVYAGLLLFLADKLSFWLDEVLQLVGVFGKTWPETLEYLTTQAGAVPLGYLVQSVFVNTLGASALPARLPSIVCAVLTAGLTGVLAFDIHRRFCVPGILILIALPLHLRYALEARPYSQALLFSTLASVLFLRLLGDATRTKAAGYGAAVLLGLYSQPFTIFVPAAHLAWTLLFYRGPDQRRVRGVVMVATGIALLAFAPWYVYAKGRWTELIGGMARQGQGFHFHAKTPLMIFREISGAGYWGGGVLLLTGLAGLRSPEVPRDRKAFLCLIVAVPVVGALVADALFDYFLAIRQMMFALPGIALLSAAGLDVLWRWKRVVGLTAMLAVAGTTFRYDVAWFQRPREDWEAAAGAIAAEAKTACVVLVPADAEPLYRFFQPSLPKHQCGASELRSKVAVVVAQSPYSSEAQGRTAIEEVTANGLRRSSERTVGMTQITRFERHHKARAASKPTLLEPEGQRDLRLGRNIDRL